MRDLSQRTAFDTKHCSHRRGPRHAASCSPLASVYNNFWSVIDPILNRFSSSFLSSDRVTFVFFQHHFLYVFFFLFSRASRHLLVRVYFVPNWVLRRTCGLLLFTLSSPVQLMSARQSRRVPQRAPSSDKAQQLSARNRQADSSMSSDFTLK